jgi:hypothetical protein
VIKYIVIPTTKETTVTKAAPSFIYELRKPTAFIPIALSLIALSVVLGSIATSGIDNRPADEGTAAHIWQLLMVLQAPFIVAFVFRWLPRERKSAVYVLALQIGAALAAMAPVYLLKL